MADVTYTCAAQAIERLAPYTYVYELVVWGYPTSGHNPRYIPAFVCDRVNFTGTDEQMREAKRTFLDLVRIKREGGVG
jgi:hypothetical protein